MILELEITRVMERLCPYNGIAESVKGVRNFFLEVFIDNNYVKRRTPIDNGHI
jgi:hypothetical protein